MCLHMHQQSKTEQIKNPCRIETSALEESSGNNGKLSLPFHLQALPLSPSFFNNKSYYNTFLM